jgi:hypothetical protein
MDASTSATPTAGNGRYVPPAPGSRSATEIRDDIVRQRGELAQSVDALRDKWAEATDVGAQLRKHQGPLIAGAAVVGLVAVGALLLSRRRR